MPQFTMKNVLLVALPIAALSLPSCRKTLSTVAGAGDQGIPQSAEATVQAALADCAKFDANAELDAKPDAIPETAFKCLATYLAAAPKVDFSAAAKSVEDMDYYREEGRLGKNGPVVFGTGTPTGSGLNLLLRAHFTYKLKGVNGRIAYNSEQMDKGIANIMASPVVQTLLATQQLLKKGKATEVPGKAPVAAAVSKADQVKFALNNLICIRNLAKDPCEKEFRYPTYVPVTELKNLSVAKPPRALGPVSLANSDIELLPGLDPAQVDELKSAGIFSEVYENRLNLIRGAEKSIRMSTWEIKSEPDLAGPKMRDAIAEARTRNPSLDVRVIGDLSTSYENPNFSQDFVTPGRIVGAFIWMVGANKNYTYHRKLTIIDDKTVIFGGKNHANTYMQLNNPQDPNPDNWRDTDIKIENPKAAELAIAMFERDWAANSPPNGQDVAPAAGNYSCKPQQGSPCFKFIAHDPARQIGYEDADSVYLAMIQEINAAQAGQNIFIENAYVIATAPLIRALQAASDRGAYTTIFTNSAQSIDVPELVGVMNLSALAILESVPHVKVVLKNREKTSTLHSKFMVIGTQTAFVGTYNMHPASRTTASEFVGVFDQDPRDPAGPVAKLSTLFKSDLQLGSEVNNDYKEKIIAGYKALDEKQKLAVAGILALGYDIL